MRDNCHVSIGAICAFITFGSAPAFAATYSVVAGGGGDFSTIQACADAVAPGDTCDVHAGTYDERVAVSIPGTAALPIVFRANGDAIVRGFQLLDAGYVWIDGFEVVHVDAAYRFGIELKD